MAQVNENNTNQAVEQTNKTNNKKKKVVEVKATQFMNFGKVGGEGRNLWFEKDEVKEIDVTNNQRLQEVIDTAVENGFLKYLK